LLPHCGSIGRRLEADDQTESCRNNRRRLLKDRIVLSLSAIIMSQLVPTHVTPALAQQSGAASVYSTESGGQTASGQKLNPGALTAAHRTLPFGTKVHVTNKKNGRSVLVTINDRGPFVRGRIIDVTPAGARALGFSGITQVTLRVGE
jgi:rare lipoprotein A